MVAVVAALLSLISYGAAVQAAQHGPQPDRKPGAEAKPAPNAIATTIVPGDDLSSIPGEPADDLGDDPELDSLAQSCSSGDLLACDQLFLLSPVDSAYEDYGDTCGGRQEGGTSRFCELGVGGLPPGPDGPLSGGEPVPPVGLGTDPALDSLAQRCYGGEMSACDELYGSAEFDSSYQAYGDTCGGRQPENTGRYCTDLGNVVPGTGDIGGTIATSTMVPLPTTAPTSAPVPTVSTPIETPPIPPTTPVPTAVVPPATQQPTGLGADPALDALAQSCYDGDLVACDDLYRDSEPGTPYRAYGDTCAGRQPEGTGTWCTSAFAGAGDTSVPAATTQVETTIAPVTTALPVPTPPITAAPSVPVTTPPVTAPALTTPPVTAPPLTTPLVTAPPTTYPFEPNTTTSTTSTIPGQIPAPTIQPVGLGTDPALDALAQSCYAGDLLACDDLYRGSAPDTPYRSYGDTCAGRQPEGSGMWCAEAFALVPTTSTVAPTTVPATTPTGVPAPTMQPVGLGADPALDALAQSCYAGDMQACDDLYDAAPLGSAYLTFGDTCAGRQPAGTLNYCRTTFPVSPRR